MENPSHPCPNSLRARRDVLQLCTLVLGEEVSIHEPPKLRVVSLSLHEGELVTCQAVAEYQGPHWPPLLAREVCPQQQAQMSTAPQRAPKVEFRRLHQRETTVEM